MSRKPARHRVPAGIQRWWPSGVRGPLIGAGIVAAVMAAAVALVRNASSIDPQPAPNQPTGPLAIPAEAVPEFCATLYELHGTDCAELPLSLIHI